MYRVSNTEWGFMSINLYYRHYGSLNKGTDKMHASRLSINTWNMLIMTFFVWIRTALPKHSAREDIKKAKERNWRKPCSNFRRGMPLNRILFAVLLVVQYRILVLILFKLRFLNAVKWWKWLRSCKERIELWQANMKVYLKIWPVKNLSYV